jgi:aconitate hydratase
MRAREGDPLRSIPRRIVDAHRAPSGGGRVDHVAITDMGRLAAVLEAIRDRPLVPELVVAYVPATPRSVVDVDALVARGVVVARPGAGTAATVHLERFASPGRVLVTDDPRLAAVGASGMLVVHVEAVAALAEVLAEGRVGLPEIATLRVSLEGKLRPFVGATDVAYALVDRRSSVLGLGETSGRPVVVEVGGPSLRVLSVHERAQIAAAAKLVGALAVVFPVDERVEDFLRDERRSKAHRVLPEEAEAPHDATQVLDLGTVGACLGTPSGATPVGKLAGEKVAQVLLGGDGMHYRDVLVVAALVRGKRVPRGLDLVFVPPSRQVLDVAASSGALADLLGAGARIVEPDPAILRGEVFVPSPTKGDGLTLSAFLGHETVERAYTASSETLAMAIARGVVHDPKAFRRLPRLKLPRSLPTDDVLIVRPR